MDWSSIVGAPASSRAPSAAGRRGRHVLMMAAAVLMLGWCPQAHGEPAGDRDCTSTPFCRRFREREPKDLTSYRLGTISKVPNRGYMGAVLVPPEDQPGAQMLMMSVHTFSDGAVRVAVREHANDRPPWPVDRDILMEEDMKSSAFRFTDGNDTVTLDYAGITQLVIHKEPFSMDLLVNGEPAVGFNKKGLLMMEPYPARKKKGVTVTPMPGQQEEEEGVCDAGNGGCCGNPAAAAAAAAAAATAAAADGEQGELRTAVGFDLTFYGAKHVYGLPGHATTFALKQTVGGSAMKPKRDGTTRAYDEPYHLNHRDAGAFDLDSPAALAGSVPFIMSNNRNLSAGALLLNPTETFVDFLNNCTGGGYQTHWVSESGFAELLLLPGPKPKDVAKQLTQAVGRQTLPPIFALGYHQSGAYASEADVAEARAQLEALDFPYDVLWLQTDAHRPLDPWDKERFPDPKGMMDGLNAQGRKLVAVASPFFPRENESAVHVEVADKGFYLKGKDGADHVVEGPAGAPSSLLDVFAKNVRQWLNSKFIAMRDWERDRLVINLYTWLDMAEPTVPGGPEGGLPKDCTTALGRGGGMSHREWRNLYGLYLQRALLDGFYAVTGHHPRPFVLSRSFWTGSQRYGGTWTGDVRASWEHLAATGPMLLSMSVAGLSFVGADVGGYLGDAEPELMVRWAQAAAFQPLFRIRLHPDATRKAPWSYDAATVDRLRAAVRLRYSLLPYWYTAFFQANHEGLPVMRPIWMDFPEEWHAYATEDQWLVGGDLLVKPVTKPGADWVGVYLPHGGRWYDIATHEVHSAPAGAPHVQVRAPLDRVPALQRGGSVIPRRMQERGSAEAMRRDPYTLVAALDHEGNAGGHIYMDDEHTVRNIFIAKEFVYNRVAVDNATTIASERALVGSFKGKNKVWDKLNATVEAIVLVGLDRKPASVSLTAVESADKDFKPRGLDFKYTPGHKKKAGVLTITGVDVRAAEKWTVTLAYEEAAAAAAVASDANATTEAAATGCACAQPCTKKDCACKACAARRQAEAATFTQEL